MKIYFIAGLGADSRVFKNIQLPPDCEPVYLNWIKPHLNESLSNYALRLSVGIDTSQPFALIGLSLGGMIAVEIAKHCPPQSIILISSISCIQCLPKYFLFGGVLGLHKIIPVALFRQASFLKRFFSAETSEDKQLLREMIRDCDTSFLRWGLQAILTWKNKNSPEGLVHIHGSADLILPKRFSNATHIIARGGHLMVMNRANEINVILKEVLNSKLPCVNAKIENEEHQT